MLISYYTDKNKVVYLIKANVLNEQSLFIFTECNFQKSNYVKKNYLTTTLASVDVSFIAQFDEIILKRKILIRINPLYVFVSNLSLNPVNMYIER